MGKGATNIHIVTLTVDGLHLHDLSRNTIFDSNLGPFGGNFTGRSVNDNEALMLLTVHHGKEATNSQAVIWQSFNSLHLTINS